ncbi:MAG: hypothetical protein LBV12_04500 [Puniceicoccales bacterium]|jgi:CRISPR-associated endonuclease Csn1|nr:hypothetical protein [Puniceicoccales bacterium]
MNNKAPISLAFDIGHSSIGWAVFEEISLKGCGTVFFGETCQNRKRAELRRARRHVAATRNRVRRLKTLLLAKGVLTESQLEGVDNSSPWHDAAQVLSGDTTLDWKRLWNVIRWYAHNRGYDGNERWANQDESESKDDTEKVQKAHDLMKKFDTGSMAETVCRALQCDSKIEKRSSMVYFKGYGAAFDRDVVVKEVRAILERHRHLKGVDDAFIAGLMDDWRILKKEFPQIGLPERFEGGLLFGQFVPRFNNRIIPACRITGKNTPDKHSEAYYEFRWMQTLSHVRVYGADGKLRGSDINKEGAGKLTPTEIAELDVRMREAGRMTPRDFKKAVAEVTEADTRQLEDTFMTEEMGEGLVLDPALATIRKYPVLGAVWENLTEQHRKIWRRRLFNGKRNVAGKLESLADWLGWLSAHGEATAPLEAAAKEASVAPAKSRGGKGKKGETSIEETFETLLARPIKLEFTASGRAPYCTEILKKASNEYRDGKDAKRGPDSDGKDAGALYETEEIREKLAQCPIDSLTNNHLIRHRLVILERVLADLVKKYADGDTDRVGSVTVEVIRDLQEFSGLSDEEKVKLLSKKTKHHKSVSEMLERELPRLGQSSQVNAALIRKVRIAEDQNWWCPYTGAKFSLLDILENGKMELDHIIPYAMRRSNSLDSLVLTFREVNELKGKRTAWDFIGQCHGQSVGPAKNLMIMPPKQFEEFVWKRLPSCPQGGWRADKREDKRAFSDDELRCRRRKTLLTTKAYNERDRDFLPGDLTQTSHLNKLAAMRINSFFGRSITIHVPGSITGLITKSKQWDTMNCLGVVVPKAQAKNKAQIREITYLHHAVDAATLGWIATFLNRGQGGKLWKAMMCRNINDPETIAIMKENGNFFCNNEGKWELRKLPQFLKDNLIKCLNECNVTQHIPSTRRGLKVKETIWRVDHTDPKNPEKVVIHYKTRTFDLTDKGPIASLTVKRPQSGSVKSIRLLGFFEQKHHGKLGAQKGTRIIDGNYGVALDPVLTVIPYYKVHLKLHELAMQNNGKWPRVLRNGMLIEVKTGSRKGKWRIMSVMDTEAYGIALDLAEPSGLQKAKGNAPVEKLIKDGLIIIKSDQQVIVS